MSDSASPPPSPAMTTLLVIAGLVFAGAWIAAHIVWASLAMMGGVMANDAGRTSTDQHMAMMGGVLAGQVMAGAAALPGGLAFFWRGRRKLLWGLFTFLFLGGALWQVLAFQSFATAASSAP